jgi:hypothetical protein
MTDLLPHRDGQGEVLTIGPGPVSFYDRGAEGTWYSPAAVARMVEEARREEREARKWRPMATAPKDGTDILLVNFAGNVAAGAYLTSAISRRGAGWVVRGSYEPDVFFNAPYGPAGWMPLPDVSEFLTKENK